MERTRLPATEVAEWLEAAAPKTATAAPSIIGHEAAPSRRFLSFRSIRRKSIFERAEIIVTLRTDDLMTEPIYLQTPPSDAPYRVIREELRFELSRWPLKIAGKRSLQNLQLLVDPFSAWVPWEAVLAGPTSPYLPFTRVAARRRPDFRPSPLPERLTAYTLTTNHAGADLSGSVWNFAPWTYAHTPRDLVANLAPGDAQILHVIADPIETSAGVRLRLSEREQTKRGLLLRSEEIGKILPNVELCLLQLPSATSSGRTGVDREKAGLLRAFAAELHAQLPTVVRPCPWRTALQSCKSSPASSEQRADPAILAGSRRPQGGHPSP